MSLFHNRIKLIQGIEILRAQGDLERFHSHANYEEVVEQFNEGLDTALAAVEQLEPFPVKDQN